MSSKSQGFPAGDAKPHVKFEKGVPQRPPPVRSGVNKDNLLLILTVFGVLAGIILGTGLRFANLGPTTIHLIQFPGELLMRMLKMMVLPLIISSLISGLAQLDTKQSGKMGSWALLYYFSTTVIAAVIGIVMVVTIRPGSNVYRDTSVIRESRAEVSTLDAMLDLIRNTFPDNLVQAAFRTDRTELVEIKNPEYNASFAINSSWYPSFDGTYNVTPTIMVRKLKVTEGMNVLGLITFSIGFGVVLSALGQQGQVMTNLIFVLNEIIMRLVKVVIWYSPMGIMCLITGKILEVANVAATAKMLGWYMATVLLGLSLHAIIVLPGLYFLVTRKNPLTFLKGMLQAWVMALGTASSSATLPITFRCLEENNGIDKRVTRFVLPVGATVNMDGTALYEAVAAIFIAQLNGIKLGFGSIIVVSLTATAASIGAASIPSAGLVTMLLVLTSVGLPTEDIAYIIAVDWLLDRIRTSVNVLGDAFGAGIVHHICKDDLEKADEKIAREIAEQAASHVNPITPADPFRRLSTVQPPVFFPDHEQSILEMQVTHGRITNMRNGGHDTYEAVPSYSSV